MKTVTSEKKVAKKKPAKKVSKKSAKAPAAASTTQTEVYFLDIYEENGSFTDPSSVLSNKIKTLIQMMGDKMAATCFSQRKQLTEEFSQQNNPDAQKIMQGYAIGFYLGINFALKSLAKKKAKK